MNAVQRLIQTCENKRAPIILPNCPPKNTAIKRGHAARTSSPRPFLVSWPINSAKELIKIKPAQIQAEILGGAQRKYRIKVERKTSPPIPRSPERKPIDPPTIAVK